MNIVDKENLVPSREIFHSVINSHPFGENLATYISTLCISSDKAGPCINFDKENNVATLYISKNDHVLDNFEYILYHEFSHIVDRSNVAFCYSDEKKNQLSDNERLCVMELWNVYIDSRLNNHGLFQLGENDKNIYCSYNGKLQKAPYSIEGKLLRHISFLASRGVENAETIVRDLWDNPDKFISYDDLIKLIQKIG